MENLQKVSQALAEAFFESTRMKAFLGFTVAFLNLNKQKIGFIASRSRSTKTKDL